MATVTTSEMNLQSPPRDFELSWYDEESKPVEVDQRGLVDKVRYLVVTAFERGQNCYATF